MAEYDDITFVDNSGKGTAGAMAEGEMPTEQGTPVQNPYPEAIISMSEEQEKKLRIYIEDWLSSLKSAHEVKMQEWVRQEINYRALPDAPSDIPFVGASRDTVPVTAMAVDPIHARLDTGIFKADPVFRFKGLKKSVLPRIPSIEAWVEFYQKHKLQLRRVSSPRLLEMTKHGTCVFKTVYDHEKYKIKTYDKDWKVVDREVVRFAGPRVFGISLADFLFPPWYQHLQDCPFVAERQRLTYDQLKIAEASGKLKNCSKVKGQESSQWTTLDDARMESSGHQDNTAGRRHIEVWEIHCDYDIDGNGLPERLIVTYHEATGTFLQVRYNWYFHQRKPYTVIPYSVANNSLYGVGIGEMTEFFQNAQTQWHRHATNNAYLANIRMFIAKRESGIEETPKLYSGKTFFVDDPRADFIPFAAADVYGSTLSERQNLFGLAEKRTGVSDYLTGRESPIVGSRATATSTVALIQEGTRRVEEVLENVRAGFAEILENCIYIWIQYGLDGLEDTVFGDDAIADDLRAFFDSVDRDNIEGALAIDLSATDAANNRSIQQQVQLAIIQVMMQYLDKLVQAGQLALQAQEQQPQLTAMISEVMKSARMMFKDLLHKYDIRNPEDYLPELENYLNAGLNGQAGGAVTPPGGTGVPTGSEGLPSVQIPNGAAGSFRGPVPSTPGSGGGASSGIPLPGTDGGLS